MDKNGPWDFDAGEVILIDKPVGWTSFDVVKKIRSAIAAWQTRHNPGGGPRKVRRLKVGHAGTLDPLASGLLILCTGRMTRDIARFQEAEKEYTGTFYIGAETPSFDLETRPGPVMDTSHITPGVLAEIAAKFTGLLDQVPPVHSAVMAGGRRAYEAARKGQHLELQARPVIIHSFEIKRVVMPLVDFRVVCGKGTYIRSLAHDFGRALGSGAYLHALCRTRIGDFRLEQAQPPDLFSALLAE